MAEFNDPRNTTLEPALDCLGYRLERKAALTEIDAFYYQLVHIGTGARHIHISTQDHENTFGVTFKTVPQDSTGVAHILEHTALCGSERYPVRDPFFSMLKRSLSTFMNAFTASDWTMYPFSTQNRKDYYNLMDVYLDAAFFPDLDALSFKQEGHRLEFEPSDDGKGEALVYKGVVYNEMKGAMSSPDQVMGRAMLNALYPDTTYGNNSGGEPRDIPALSHAQLKAFHQHHYHPSNAFFYTYGNLPLEGHLTFIDTKIMSRFERIDPQTDVPAQPRWPEPRYPHYVYAISPGEKTDRKSQVCVAWLTGDVQDTFHVLVMTVLEQVLLGNAASPLRKALMDANLGSALSDGTGYDADNRDTLFACGLKDTDEASAERIEAIIFETLEQLASDGIAQELIDSAVHQIEFHRKEITNTPYPYGLRVLLTIISCWLHGGDPQRILQLDSDLDRLRGALQSGGFLESVIRTTLIDNPHRIRMVLAPDPHKAAEEEAHEAKILAQRLKSMTEEEKTRIREDAQALKAQQEQQEDLSCLPTLALEDIPGKVPTVKPSGMASELPLWRYEQSTSGIHYLNAIAMAGVSQDMRPWVPFFCYAFTKAGTAVRSYTEMARMIDSVTGGVVMSASARTPNQNPDRCLPLISLNAKCLARNIDATAAILDELVGQYDFSDHDRLTQLLGEYRAGLEAMIVHNGHRLAISLSSRSFTPASALSETWSGVHQLQAIRQWTEKKKGSVATLADLLAHIAETILSPENVVMAAIGDAADIDQSASAIARSSALSRFKFRGTTPSFAPQAMAPVSTIPREGWSTSSAVAFVAKTIPTVPLGHPQAPALAVLAKMLRSLYLHREIREKGGAYGGFALYNPENGLFSLASYRDPHIVRTLEVFDGVGQFAIEGQFTQADIVEAILQVCSEIDKPDPPGPAARKAFSRMVVGLSDADRLAFKQALLQVTPDTVAEAAQTYFGKQAPDPGIAVIAGAEQLEEANADLESAPLNISAI